MSKTVKLEKSQAFLLSVAVGFLVPILIPGVGIDYTYFFIIAIVLMAWFAIKWNSVKRLLYRSSLLETILGVLLIGAVYAYDILLQKRVGLLDDIVIFSGIVVAFYGIKSFKLFWVPTVYGIVLLLGYQLENAIPNYVALQNWMAGVMASSMDLLGINATVSGHIVTMNSSVGPLLLNVEGDCTGVQGILAFGMLSTLAILDVKVKVSKLIPLFAIGFLGAFLINIVRLFGVFLTFEYLGVNLGNEVHVYLGYLLFIAWVMVFWMLAFRYLVPPVAHGSSSLASPATPPPPPGKPPTSL